MGSEAFSESQKVIYRKYNLDEVKKYLNKRINNDWSFLVTGNKLSKFKSIPKLNDKYELGKIRCELLALEVDIIKLIFNFVYAGVSMAINLVNRDLSWIKPF